MTRYLEQNYHVVKQDNHCRVSSPYPTNIREYQYPEYYISPKFKTYDGQGNAWEHLSRFLSATNDRASDGKLCLKEFPKSLTGTTFTWYDNLKAESVDSWPTMSTLFLRKFYSVKRKITTIDLSKNGQQMGKEIGKYILRFWRLELNYQEDISKETLVEICVRGMIPAFKGSLINFRFHTFVELEEAAERIADYIEEIPIDPSWRHTVSTVSEAPRNVRPNTNRERRDQFQTIGRNHGRSGRTRHDSNPPPPLPCRKERTVELLGQWVTEQEIQLPPTVVDVNKMDKNSARYCHYNRRLGHPTE
ncbi:uncharacterized protein LOC113279386 [Papaver somniferum]|uniref:uncharacterized protein LOC113279386 n=1 Tax=Papaver somniferum TaxID=3469 RepID=UPI000E6FB627|nr:uncharacterized protein LOC113279386 [Papaver somniferum]